MFSKLLAATETPTYCDECVTMALRIAEQHGAKVHILHVLESDTPLYRNYVRHFLDGEEILASDAYVEEVEQELIKACSSPKRFGVNWEVRVKAGLPWEEILKFARDKDADLIVMNPSTRKAGKRKIGSTVGGVIRRQRCPVMIVNQFPPKEHLQFKSVMVCIDFSASCLHALEFAVKLAAVYGSKVHLVHVVEASSKVEPAHSETDQSLKKLEDIGRAIPESIQREIIVIEGKHPHLEILKAAGENDIDLLVMGSHTKVAGTEWYLGGVAERVSSRSSCPVTLITDPKAIKRWRKGSS
jgi:nucleotide-binding universal stress UspA family protein